MNELINKLFDNDLDGFEIKCINISKKNLCPTDSSVVYIIKYKGTLIVKNKLYFSIIETYSHNFFSDGCNTRDHSIIFPDLNNLEENGDSFEDTINRGKKAIEIFMKKQKKKLRNKSLSVLEETKKWEDK